MYLILFILIERVNFIYLKKIDLRDLLFILIGLHEK